MKKEPTEQEILDLLDQKERKNEEHHPCSGGCDGCIDEIYKHFQNELQRIGDESDHEKAARVANIFKEALEKEEVDAATFADIAGALFAGYFADAEELDSVLSTHLTYMATKINLAIKGEK